MCMNTRERERESECVRERERESKERGKGGKERNTETETKKVTESSPDQISVQRLPELPRYPVEKWQPLQLLSLVQWLQGEKQITTYQTSCLKSLGQVLIGKTLNLAM